MIIACTLTASCTRIAPKLLEDEATTGATATKSKIPTTAQRVYGQLGSFTSGAVNNGGITANSLKNPTGVAVDSTGVYIADNQNYRVLFYSTTSTTATRVYGQGGSFTTAVSNNGGPSSTSILSSIGIGLDSGGVYISDFGNRVLYYSGTSTTGTRVYGHFGAFNCMIANDNAACAAGTPSASTLTSSNGVATDGSGVYIADYNNHRVLYFTGTNIVAARAYGQGGSTLANTSNNGGISADSLSSPYYIAIDSGGIYIADYGNNRVLYYSGTSTTATRVYGQGGSFTTNTANKGGLSADSLSGPGGVYLDSTGVYVADTTNNRILFYPGTSTTASTVWGQNGSFTTNTANNGGLSASSLSGPTSVFIYNGNMFIADYNNHRVLMY